MSLLSIGWLVSLIPSDYFINRKESKFKLNYPVAWIVYNHNKKYFWLHLNIGWNFNADITWSRVDNNIYRTYVE